MIGFTTTMVGNEEESQCVVCLNIRSWQYEDEQVKIFVFPKGVVKLPFW